VAPGGTFTANYTLPATAPQGSIEFYARHAGSSPLARVSFTLQPGNPPTVKCPSNPTIDFEENSGPPGDGVVITGSGWLPGGTITVESGGLFSMEPENKFTKVATDGSFAKGASVVYWLNGGAPVGGYNIKFVEAYGGCSLKASQTFTVWDLSIDPDQAWAMMSIAGCWASGLNPASLSCMSMAVNAARKGLEIFNPPKVSLSTTPSAHVAAASSGAVEPRSNRMQVRFRIPRAGVVTFTILQRFHSKSGAQYVPVRGALVVHSKPGLNRFYLTRRWGGRTLTPGEYRLVATTYMSVGVKKAKGRRYLAAWQAAIRRLGVKRSATMSFTVGRRQTGAR